MPKSPSVSSVEDVATGKVRSRIWVVHSDCARIIGKKGETRMDMERQSEATIRVQREEEMDTSKKPPERFIDVIGSRPARKKAVQLVMKLATTVRDDHGKALKDLGSAQDGGSTSEIIQILCDEVGRLLGRGGDNIRRLEEETGARLELDRSEGRLQMSGPREAVAAARARVLGQVTFAKTADGTVIKDDVTGVHAPPAVPHTWQPAPLRLWIYSREAGRVIGRGGEAVREVMQRTGAEIQVQRTDAPDHGNSERNITVLGTRQQQEDALAAIVKGVSFCRGEFGLIKSEDMPGDGGRLRVPLSSVCAGPPGMGPGMHGMMGAAANGWGSPGIWYGKGGPMMPPGVPGFPPEMMGGMPPEMMAMYWAGWDAWGGKGKGPGGMGMPPFGMGGPPGSAPGGRGRRSRSGSSESSFTRTRRKRSRKPSRGRKRSRTSAKAIEWDEL